MKNILTIDMDFISTKYLHGALAKFVGGPITKNYWETMLKVSGHPRSYLQDSIPNVMFIFNLVNTVLLTQKPQVVFGTYHDAILNHIEGTNLNIVNIDHHHDIAYVITHEVEADVGECSEANWVTVIKDDILKYTWVGNSNSEPFRMERPLPFEYQSKLLSGVAELNLKETEWDLVYITLSPNYTADDHWYYYYMLIDMYETISGERALVDTTRGTPILTKFN